MRLKTENLSWHARQRLGELALKVADRAFDSADVELLVTYARQAYGTRRPIHEFADLMAHPIRNQGRLQKAVVRLSTASHEDAMRHLSGQAKGPWKPIGDNVGFDENQIRQDLDALMLEYDRDPVDTTTLHEFEACLAIMGNQAELVITEDAPPNPSVRGLRKGRGTKRRGKKGRRKRGAADRKARHVGTAHLMLVEGKLSLDVCFDETDDTESNPYAGLHLIMLNAPIEGMDDCQIIFGRHSVWAEREAVGRPLRICFDDADFQSRIPTSNVTA